jgi:hypothetical protein
MGQTAKETGMTPTPQMVAQRHELQTRELEERLAPNFGYETREETREFDPTTKNGHLMVAVCAELLSKGLAQP